MNSFYFHNTRGRTIGQSQKQVKRGSPGAQSGSMVPGGRVELPLSCENRILSPARLPVPPSGHTHVLSPADVFLACHRQRVNRQLSRPRRQVARNKFQLFVYTLRHSMPTHLQE